jgi:hypothetical protein
MHPLRHPRNAALSGLIFIVIAIILWGVPTSQGLTVSYNDVIAGATMLLFLGVAMAIMAYVLIAASSDE